MRGRSLQRDVIIFNTTASACERRMGSRGACSTAEWLGLRSGCTLQTKSENWNVSCHTCLKRASSQTSGPFWFGTLVITFVLHARHFWQQALSLVASSFDEQAAAASGRQEATRQPGNHAGNIAARTALVTHLSCLRDPAQEYPMLLFQPV